MNSMEDLISIIVPVYNARKYIASCVESVEKQTYQNIELYFIDDCSKDDTYKICCEFASKKEWIKCCRMKSNGGPGAARNIGIKNAVGKYFYFLDVDDLLDENALEKLIEAYTRFQVDFVIGNCKRVDVFNSVIIEWPNENRLFSDRDSVKKLIESYAKDIKSNKILYSAWGKLYRKDIIENNQVFFNEALCIYEDVEFVISYIAYCDSVYYLGECLYTYRHFGEGIASKRAYVQPFDFKQVILKIRMILYENKYRNVLDDCYSEYAIWVMFSNVRLLERKEDFHKLYQNIRLIINDPQLQAAIHHYVQKHDDNAKIIPKLIKLRWSIAVIAVFKYQIARKKRRIIKRNY